MEFTPEKRIELNITTLKKAPAGQTEGGLILLRC